MLCPGFLHKTFERICKAVVHIKGRFVVHRGCNEAQVELRGGFIGRLVQLAQFSADDIPVIVDGGNPLHIAAIGNLISLCVKPVSGSPIGNGLLRVSQIIHPLKCAGNTLTGSIEADLAVHVDVQRILCLSDGCKQSLLLAKQVQQELGNSGDSLVILRIRSSD